jgi:hypothetical protein
LKRFNFRKRIKRNDFTSVFGGVGRRRSLTHYAVKPQRLILRFKMQQVRRAHQGYRNRVFGTASMLRIRKTYGRRKPIGSFRR